MVNEVVTIDTEAEQQDQPEADVVETEEGAAEQQSGDADEGEDKPESDSPDDEVEVTIAGETPAPEQEPAPAWVRELRKQNREQARLIRELKAEKEKPQIDAKAPVLGSKPTLAESDYDDQQFEAKLAAWFERKREIEVHEAQAKKAAEEQQSAWANTIQSYAEKKTALKVADYEDAEAATQEALNTTQQGIVLQGAENPALVVYALGRNPKKAAEIAAIKDPVKFAFAVAKLEKDLKVTNRKAPAPAPERTVSGTGRPSGSVDSQLERLRADAEKSGDYTKVTQYKRQLAAKSK